MPPLKLNYKRTILIGFAFLGISLLWQVYDSWCPTFLTDIFAHKIYSISSTELKMSDPTKILNIQWLVGIIMACDNLAALILLPIFGDISDRIHTPIGKRMPFILVGTLVSALAFPLIPVFFHYNNFFGMVITMAVVLIFMMMYRNPAVSLMPDITPKPLRTRANGIINTMGYLGAAITTILGLFLQLSDYINADNRTGMMWVIEIPFLAASIVLIITTLILFLKMKENELAVTLKEEMDEGERLAGVEPSSDDKPLGKSGILMLLAIMCAEFLWFMADNALSTYIGNYVIYYLNSSSGFTMIVMIISGAVSVIGFMTAGFVADKIGRKWTVSIGLGISVLAMFLMALIHPTGIVVGGNGEFAFPFMIYIACVFRGYGMSLVYSCSFPMVLELCSSSRIGKFTGYYYLASMAAQTITPILFGFVLFRFSAWRTLPVYAAVMLLCSFTVFTIFVKNIRTSKIPHAKGFDALGDD